MKRIVATVISITGLLAPATFVTAASSGSNPAFTGTDAVSVPQPLGAEGAGNQDQLRRDVLNHTKKLDAAIKARDTKQVTESTGFLREDAKALLKTVDAASAQGKKLATHQATIVSLTGKIERNADKGEWGDAREFYGKLKKAVDAIEASFSGAKT